MKKIRQRKSQINDAESLNTELLILPDGRILVQNLTQPMADLLSGLNPKDDTVRPRTEFHTQAALK